MSARAAAAAAAAEGVAKRLAELRAAAAAAAEASDSGGAVAAGNGGGAVSWQREERWRGVADGRGTSESEGAFVYTFDNSNGGEGGLAAGAVESVGTSNNGGGVRWLSPAPAPAPAPAPLRFIETHEDTAGRVWDAAVQLGKFLELQRLQRGPPLLPLWPRAFAVVPGATPPPPLPQPPLSPPLRVLEIGAGMGLVSLVVARLLACPARVLATDLPGVVPRLRRNFAVNGFGESGEGGGAGAAGAASTAAATSDAVSCVVGGNAAATAAMVCRCDDLRWGDAGAAARAVAWLGGQPHLVLASDLAATVAAMAPCVATLREVLAQDSVLLLACHTHRDSTAPLLEGLREFCSVRRVRESALPPRHRSGKHELFRGAGLGGEADAALAAEEAEEEASAAAVAAAAAAAAAATRGREDGV
jgi:predicted nicotinamide N-methyase